VLDNLLEVPEEKRAKDYLTTDTPNGYQILLTCLLKEKSYE